MTYNEIHEILVKHHKAYKNAVKLSEKEEELLNDYAADLDMDIEGAFENQEKNKGILKKCPFCGKESFFNYYYSDDYDRDIDDYRDTEYVCVKCSGCCIQTVWYENTNDIGVEKAKIDWNSRA